MKINKNGNPTKTSQHGTNTGEIRKPNRLIHEKSPYLQQHAYNPVDWYPWGEEAFQKAAKENKPVFLSIGYSTCHWCHVMEYESFEDEEVAEILNENFISIKVDREERPDLDSLYMTVCQAMTGSGGWPLNLFLTPQKKPFFAGTYFPKTERFGNPGFIHILKKITDLWKTNNESVVASSEQVTKVLQSSDVTIPGETLTKETLKHAYEQLRSNFDPVYGGFGTSPKFPTPHNFTFLLRWWKRSNDPQALEMVEKTLERMGYGGIYDQLGGGFHRYSTDEYWLVPHFEKMLYDQALMAVAYTEAFQSTGKLLYAGMVQGIFEYVLRDMTSPEGGFYTAEDADSEGIEGKFYVWTPEEILTILGKEEGKIFCEYYDVTKEGNFEGKNILRVDIPLSVLAKSKKINPEELQELLNAGRKKLFSAREKRIHPHKDDKILTSWNGLMIAALAKGAQVLCEPKYTQAAIRAAEFVLHTLQQEDGTLLRRYRQGEASIPGYLDDYTFFTWGLIDLYEATFEVKYLKTAMELTKQTIENFWDEEKGGFLFSGKKNEQLIAPTKEIYDGAIPSGNSVALLNILRLEHMTGNTDLGKIAEQLIETFGGTVNQFPSGYTQFLCGLDFGLGPVKEIVIAGEPESDDTRQILQEIRKRFLPGKVLLLHPEKNRSIEKIAEFVKEQKCLDNKATVYLCENRACKAPTNDLDKIIQLLEEQ
ncbi:MAG: thioredoxin domain-containing protein [Candidatus Loosdrechtia sp.]|uniref:thioredoxin domain-containing protein n=1 Tax=Candidatus Loosdrechtia sp. TaxID=3101272 RepID=UPI003A782256|nr:MAG: thioredoxin domain-containing protein [Candidatus Jettenia sp. AMX2]